MDEAYERWRPSPRLSSAPLTMLVLMVIVVSACGVPFGVQGDLIPSGSGYEYGDALISVEEVGMVEGKGASSTAWCSSGAFPWVALKVECANECQVQLNPTWIKFSDGSSSRDLWGSTETRLWDMRPGDSRTLSFRWAFCTDATPTRLRLEVADLDVADRSAEVEFALAG